MGGVMFLSQSIKRAFKACGVSIDRFRPYRDEMFAIRRACERAHVDLILDIGANDGGFVRELSDTGISVDFLSIEPTSAAHGKLLNRSRSNPRWHVARRLCIGNKTGTVEINVSANSVSSSLLPIVDKSVDANKETNYRSSESVDMITIDILSSENPKLEGAQRIMLKADTQGFELEVLRGAQSTLDRIEVIYLELSLTDVYQGAQYFDEVISHIQEKNYECIGLFPGFTNPETYDMLQVNGLFKRPRLDK